MKPAPIEAVVVVNDTHSGSTFGLCPPDFELIDGNRVRLNAAQKFLHNAWVDVCDELTAYLRETRFVVVFNGDLIEGVHHGTKEVISSDIGDHINAAVELLQPLASKAAQVFVVEGTECHTGNTESGIGKALGAVPVDGHKNRYAWHRLDLEVHGCRVVFHHHIGVTSRQYLEASALSIYLGNERLEAIRNNEPPPQVLCCAHRHRFGQYSDNNSMCVVGPPWQLLTRHGRKVVPGARTEPGLFVLDWRGKDRGALPHVEAMTRHRPYEGPIKV